MKYKITNIGLLSIVFTINSYVQLVYGFSAIPFTTLEKGTYSGIIELSFVVIRNKDEWNNFWDRHVSNIIPKPDVPEIDFSKEMVIGVFTGQKSSGGYTVEIVNILKDERIIKVFYKEKAPLPEEIVTTVFTQPYHFIKMPKEGLLALINLTQHPLIRFVRCFPV